jgi:tetratricopeptide (TPR) repeat protein
LRIRSCWTKVHLKWVDPLTPALKLGLVHKKEVTGFSPKLLRVFYLALILLIISNQNILPQTQQFDSLVTTGIKQIYSINFNDAEVTFRKLMADYPDHPAGRFFLAMIDWWRILLDLDVETYDEIFFQKIEDVIYNCEQILDKDPNNVDALFFKGGAIGFRGRLRAYRESWLKAADDGREALPIVEQASLLDPNNVDVQLGFGIYNYYAEVIPNQYPLLKPLMIFFPEGNREKGIEQLTNTALNGKYAKYEARYFLMTLYYSYENNPYKAEEFANMLVSDFPNNPIFEKWSGRIQIKRGDYYSGSQIFSSVMTKAQKNLPGYNTQKTKREASYYIGLQYRNIGQLDSAKYFFQMCADLSKEIDTKEESGFWINAYLYLGMINDQLGNRSKAVEYYEKILDMREYLNSHELATKYLNEPFKN